jgi:putative transcriptional regulator
LSGTAMQPILSGMPESSLKNHFLIAMPGLDDPNFSRTVTFICDHDENGAMGIIINRPSELHLADVLEHMGIDNHTSSAHEQIVYLGGPVQEERGFVLHSPREGGWKSSIAVTDEIGITTSRDILEAMANDRGPDKSLVALGYAGWGAGQLENEIKENAWLSGPADTTVLFDLPPAQRWAAAARILGVDMTLMSSDAGHA